MQTPFTFLSFQKESQHVFHSSLLKRPAEETTEETFFVMMGADSHLKPLV